MKRMLLLIVTFLAVALFFFNDLYAQAVFGPVRAKYTRDLREYRGTVSSYGVYPDTETRVIDVGKEGEIRKRVVFQWEIPESSIPDGSTINSVKIRLLYSLSEGYSKNTLPVKFFNVGIDILNPNNNSIWAVTDPSTLDGIGTAEGVADPVNLGNYMHKIEATFPGSSAMAGAISGALVGNKFILGVAWQYESPSAGSSKWAVLSNCELTVYFKPKEQFLTVDQKLSNSDSYGNIELHDGNVFQSYQAPHTFSLPINSVQYLRADTNKATVADEKFSNWNNSSNVLNHYAFPIDTTTQSIVSKFYLIGTATVKNALEGLSSVSGDVISFQDPWLRDDNTDSKGLTNRGTGAIWHSHSSPFVQDINNIRFKGVLLNQSRNNLNHYNALAKPSFDLFLPQTGKTHTFYFINWTSTNADVTYPMVTETPVVFTANNAEVKANYKASMLSGTQTAFANSSQRKFIRNPNDGYYHLVYESMGKIWYERSSNGINWTLGNNGKPLNTDYVFGPGGVVTGTGNYTVGKHPSLDYYQDKILVVWQEQSGSNYIVKLLVITDGQPAQAANIPFTNYGLYSEDIYPQIAAKDNGYAIIAIRRNDNLMKGLEVHYITLVNASLGMATDLCSGTITGTDQYTGSFTIATDRNYTDKFHIAWEQNPASSIDSIKYTRFNFPWIQGEEIPHQPAGYYEMNPIITVNVSKAAGYTRSYLPSMIGANDGTARLAFKGYRKLYYGSGTYSISLVNPDNLSWIPYLRKYNSEVFSPQISAGSETYFVGWTENYGGSYKTIVTDALTLRNMETLTGSSGRDMQINPWGTRLQQFAMGFNSESTSLPYVFSLSSAIGDIQVNKKLQISSGRAVFLSRGESQIYFTLGNVSLDGLNIDFIKSKDSVRLDGDLKKVNSFLVTEPFSLKDNSSVSFAVMYGTKDSSVSKSSIKEGEFASFKVEMIDDASGRVIGSYLDEKMDKSNIFSLKEGVYKINSDGIGNKLVRLRISVNENMKSQYTISDMILGSGLPLSKSLKEMEMGLNGSLGIKEYSLSPNYPNPFNPTTMISYQLPKPSKVTLKVYDILGKEVATLVNGYEETGKYSVEFNASNLPSGIYIYEIRASDFVKSGKMMLLK